MGPKFLPSAFTFLPPCCVFLQYPKFWTLVRVCVVHSSDVIHPPTPPQAVRHLLVREARFTRSLPESRCSAPSASFTRQGTCAPRSQLRGGRVEMEEEDEGGGKSERWRYVDWREGERGVGKKRERERGRGSGMKTWETEVE